MPTSSWSWPRPGSGPRGAAPSRSVVTVAFSSAIACRLAARMACTASRAGCGHAWQLPSASSATPAWMAITAIVWAVMSCRSRASRSRSSLACESNVGDFNFGGLNDSLRVTVEGPPDTGAWVLSNQTVNASGHAVDAIPLSTSPGPCTPSPGALEQGLSACLAEVTRLGYRQQVTYQPSSRFWAFQWYETGIYTALTLGLAGFCLWWIRRRLS
jgi:hypothetical protein